MSLLGDIGKTTFNWASKNAPTIMTCAGAAGVILTAVASGKAAIKAKKIIDEMPEGTDTIEKVKKVAPVMAKPFFLAFVTICLIFSANKIALKRNAALLAAYTLSTHQFEEYEEKVVDTIGENKNKKIKDKLAEDAVLRNPPSDDLLIQDDGKILCFDKKSGRYFRAKIEDIDKALNYINFILNEEGFVSLNEWYDKLGLEGVEDGECVGWQRDIDGLVSLDPPYVLTSMLYKDTYPVRVISFSVKPKEYYDY